MREHVLSWMDDLEEDLTDAGSAKVFVPSIMGAGIIVSVGVLLGDLRRLVAAEAGRARHRLRVARRAVEMVVPIAGAAGVSLPQRPTMRRRLRTRTFYFVTFVASFSLSIYVGVGSTFNYLRAFGPFSHKVWMESLAISVSVAFFVTALIAGSIALRYRSAPRWARVAIDRSLLGAIDL